MIKRILFFLLFIPGLNAQIIDTLVVSDVEVKPEAGINTIYAEFSPTYYFDGIAYVSAADSSLVDEAIGQPFFDIMCAVTGEDGFLHTAKPIHEINSPSHEGPLAFDEESNAIYFTRVDIIKGRAVRRIYKDTEASPSQALNFSTERDQVCHPALNPSGDMMIFSADYGQGHMDLYTSTLIENEWSEPEIIDGVNGTHHEFFPYLYNDKTLVFSSDRPEGYGGYDLYITRKENGIWTRPQILLPPLNSAFDDLGLIIKEDGKSGYFSSNRPGGQGKDDVYRWRSDQSIFYDENNYLATYPISVKDKLDFHNVEGARVKITAIDVDSPLAQLRPEDKISDIARLDSMILAAAKSKNGTKQEFTTDKSGMTSPRLLKNTTYAIVTRMPGYDQHVLIYNTLDSEPINILLEPRTPEVQDAVEDVYIPTRTGETVVFDNIYYEYNSSKIKPGAAEELDALARVMTKNPDMMIQLAAHTDSRGPSSYNQSLSEKRAQAAKDYLVGKGISVSRIMPVGFGESRLRNACKDDVPCTEEEHRFNRRTEVKVLDF